MEMETETETGWMEKKNEVTASRWHVLPRGADKAPAQDPRRDRATGQAAARSSQTDTNQQSLAQDRRTSQLPQRAAPSESGAAGQEGAVCVEVEATENTDSLIDFRESSRDPGSAPDLFTATAQRKDDLAAERTTTPHPEEPSSHPTPQDAIDAVFRPRFVFLHLSLHDIVILLFIITGPAEFGAHDATDGAHLERKGGKDKNCRLPEGTLFLSHTPSFSNLSLISQLNMPGFSLLYSSIFLSTSGEEVCFDGRKEGKQDFGDAAVGHAQLTGDDARPDAVVRHLHNFMSDVVGERSAVYEDATELVDPTLS
ncbi:hypothetical protein EYF80_046450 [Liparis tanakae]|uniref:Uncharacterized protein n=1 Tax=Liparis tanakae TaxID=230148 RepID=A0A4Z2FSJ2_9TELE|nr:hypothetical protein EYF80_046450 [Liparis tanakae]